MYTAILILHIIVCFFLVFIVLIQSGKGAELGAAFGGSSQTLFGARGAATIFSKLTTISAVVFMITSLTLSIITAKGGSVIRRTPAAVEQKTKLPAVPAGPVKGAPAPSAPAPQGAPASSK
jgi:preprotein translocase subunit SecG